MSIKKSNVVSKTANIHTKQTPINYQDSDSLMGDSSVSVAKCQTTNNIFKNKHFKIEGNRMAFDPSIFSQDELFDLLNADDSMSLEIKVLDENVKIRSNPNEASNIILIAKTGTSFEVSKQWRGWFYITLKHGWIPSNQVLVTKVIKPYDPETDVDFDEDVVEQPIPKYDAAEIIKSLIASVYKLPSFTVKHTHKKEDGTYEESLLSVLLDQFIGSRNLVDKLNDKVGGMPKIPKLPDDITGKLTLVNIYNPETETSSLEWKLVDFNDIINIPELDLIGGIEF